MGRPKKSETSAAVPDMITTAVNPVVVEVIDATPEVVVVESVVETVVPEIIQDAVVPAVIETPEEKSPEPVAVEPEVNKKNKVTKRKVRYIT